MIKIYQRANRLKSMIKNSEVFSKYLVRKEMISHRFRDRKSEIEINITKRLISKTAIEEERILLKNRFQKIKKSLISEPLIKYQLKENKKKYDKSIEELKHTHSQKVEELKSQFREDQEKYEKEKKDILKQKIEIEREFKKNQKLF